MWGLETVQPPAALRLYRATVDVAYVLDDSGRDPVPLG